jgi:hypothetical protein
VALRGLPCHLDLDLIERNEDADTGRTAMNYYRDSGFQWRSVDLREPGYGVSLADCAIIST